MEKINVIVRAERPEDYDTISDIHTSNFSHDVEAKLIINLRNVDGYDPMFSQVVELDGKVVGHLMLTPVLISNCKEDYKALMVAPVGIKKEYQKLGLGSLLVNKSIEIAESHGYKIFLVYGGDYYRKFGFVPAEYVYRPNPVRGHGLLIRMKDYTPTAIAGVVHYPSPFNPLINEWNSN